VITGADVSDDFDGFLASWSHQEINLEGDPVGVDGFPGRKERQNHQIMEPARHGLAFTFESGRRLDIAVEQVIRNHRVEPEADGLRLFGDVDQDAVLDGLRPCIGVDEVPVVISRHFQHHPASDLAVAQAYSENSP